MGDLLVRDQVGDDLVLDPVKAGGGRHPVDLIGYLDFGALPHIAAGVEQVNQAAYGYGARQRPRVDLCVDLSRLDGLILGPDHHPDPRLPGGVAKGQCLLCLLIPSQDRDLDDVSRLLLTQGGEQGLGIEGWLAVEGHDHVADDQKPVGSRIGSDLLYQDALWLSDQESALGGRIERLVDVRQSAALGRSLGAGDHHYRGDEECSEPPFHGSNRTGSPRLHPGTGRPRRPAQIPRAPRSGGTSTAYSCSTSSGMTSSARSWVEARTTGAAMPSK